MSRTLPLAFVYWLAMAVFGRHLYLWAKYTTIEQTAAALKAGFITEFQQHCLDFKRAMLNPAAYIVVSLICFGVWFLFARKLNQLSLVRDTQSPETIPYWIAKFENISGPGLLLYALTMTAAAIYWVMSMDVTWASAVYGLLFLVGQGYSVLALGIVTVVALSRAEPFKTLLRQSEQHDLGKLAFAFVMLNVYLAFSQFLIVWSGNLPDETGWYLDRTRGGWGAVMTLDFVFHWLVPFALLLSRNLKRNKKRLAAVCLWMIFARCWDMFWLIEPNFPDAARNLHFSWGILEYIAVPVVLISFWAAYYAKELAARPLVAINDPQLSEILEAEDAAV